MRSCNGRMQTVEKGVSCTCHGNEPVRACLGGPAGTTTAGLRFFGRSPRGGFTQFEGPAVRSIASRAVNRLSPTVKTRRPQRRKGEASGRKEIGVNVSPHHSVTP